jgi:hypothetical protein
MTNSHGTSRPHGAKSSLNFFPSFVGKSGVSATRLIAGSGGGVFCDFGVASNLVLVPDSEDQRNHVSPNGLWQLLGVAAALVEVFRVTSEAMLEG